jgi:hypothetical protein
VTSSGRNEFEVDESYPPLNPNTISFSVPYVCFIPRVFGSGILCAKLLFCILWSHEFIRGRMVHNGPEFLFTIGAALGIFESTSSSFQDLAWTKSLEAGGP